MTSRTQFDYDGIRTLSDKLSRPMSTLIALSGNNDPFYITSARQEQAMWFAELWERLNAGAGMHLRKFHYRIISQKAPIIKLDGTPYENTMNDWQGLSHASRDARYLGLVPAEHFVDRRNNEPIIFLSETSDSAATLLGADSEPTIDDGTVPSVSFEETEMPYLPFLYLKPPTIGQRFHVEIWCEKTTENEILEPLARQYDCNLITGAGEQSLTACIDVVGRIKQSGKPTRILYISDFDPAGMSMPVAVARKLEFEIRKSYIEVDVQVRPIVLTLKQCKKYRLPRTPIKVTERRADAFQDRFGEGATELDALDELCPGELRKIVKREIERYYDADLASRIRETAAEINAEIDKLEEQVQDNHRDKIDALEEEWSQIVAEGNYLHERLEEESAELQAKINAWEERAEPLYRAIAESLNAQAPDLDDYEWPEPDEGDEDEDPLYDSTRDYVEQIDRYKEHQGRPTERRAYGSRPEDVRQLRRKKKMRKTRARR